MNNKRIMLLAATLAAPATAAAGGELAQSGSRPAGEFTFEAGAGVQHDSNVAVPELDNSTGRADDAALLDLGVGYKHAINERASVTLDYALTHSEYEDYSDYDLTTQRASADFGYDLEVADTGLSYHFVDARLGNDGFLRMEQASPYVGRLFGDRLYLRGAYTWTEKNFIDRPWRDADADALSSDAFVFVRGLDTYVTFGYQRNWENAQARQFDYEGDQLSAHLTHRLNAFALPLELRSGVRYQNRDYEFNPSLGRNRNDERYRYDASVAVPVTDALTLRAEYEYGDFRSNLASMDFTEHLVSVRLNARI